MDNNTSRPGMDSSTTSNMNKLPGDKDGGCDLQDEKPIDLQVTFHGKLFTLQVPESVTISQLSEILAESFSIDREKQKLLITPKPGIIKPPFPDTHLSVVYTPKTKITLLGNTQKEISDLSASIHKVQAESRRRLAAKRDAPKPARNRDWKKTQEEKNFNFHVIRPLPYLSNPDRSQRFLQRLADDPGIKTVMRSHRFSVGLLTEMNPAEHTSLESRTLGLNRDGGEVIELRLRTDRYDGYRDYKVIRKTLCHELAHNVFGEHNRDFWDLTGQIEKEVERNDWKHGGHKLAEDEFYNPEDQGFMGQEEHQDDGGWTGGEYVLGSNQHASGSQGLSRREILARAAMGRVQKQRQTEEDLDEMGEDGQHTRNQPL